MIFKAASPPFLFQVYPETENMSMTYSHNAAILGRAAGEESSAGAQPILQKSFKGAWGQISPTSAKWLQATLLAKCEAGRVRRLASSKVGTALPCLPVRFPFCKGTLFLIEGAPGKIRSRTESCDSVQH